MDRYCIRATTTSVSARDQWSVQSNVQIVMEVSQSLEILAANCLSLRELRDVLFTWLGGGCFVGHKGRPTQYFEGFIEEELLLEQ